MLRSPRMMPPAKRLLLLAGVCVVAFWLLFVPSKDASHLGTSLERQPFRVVASLTSFPGRLENLNATLASLASQSYKLDAIYLQIPWTVKRIAVPAKLPEIVGLLERQYAPLLQVRRCDDYGPGTKLLGTLLTEKAADTVVVTVDDDVEYHGDTVRSLLRTLLLNPTHQPCFVCEYWPWWSPWLPLHQRSEGVCYGWANAYSAIAYRVGWFGADVFDELSAAPKGCLLHDDVFLSGYLWRRGVRPYLIRPGFFSVRRHLQWNELSIHSVRDGERDYRDPCVAHFAFFR